MKNIALLIVIIFALGLGAFYLSRQQATPSPAAPATTNQQPTKTFQSKSLKFSVDIPQGFTAKENFTQLAISSSQGEILITRFGTNFSDVNAYIDDLFAKNKTQTLNKKTLQIDGLQWQSRVISYPGGPASGEYNYYVYVGNAVFDFSTSSPSLYPVLDQMVRTFKFLL
ncbi:MAG: hypothetical protein M1484_02810 [Patescibacteria group bacterium]|nr:hypothetical protein [Patescibacteria group bacterium]MCL5432012.1 hypothetical protein [Patescibacteria group bacterium]